jgi:hypothetical protein
MRHYKEQKAVSQKEHHQDYEVAQSDYNLGS